jgi:hypothetical protein
MRDMSRHQCCLARMYSHFPIANPQMYGTLEYGDGLVLAIVNMEWRGFSRRTEHFHHTESTIGLFSRHQKADPRSREIVFNWRVIND